MLHMGSASARAMARASIRAAPAGRGAKDSKKLKTLTANAPYMAALSAKPPRADRISVALSTNFLMATSHRHACAVGPISTPECLK